MKTSKHETKTCPHCQKNFECKCGDVINCQCETIELKQQHRDYIFKQYDDCLCASCMAFMRSEYNISQFYQKINQLIEHK